MKSVEKAYKYRIYPNKKQQEIIQKTFGCCRFVYNKYLAKRIEMYEKKQLKFFIVGIIQRQYNSKTSPFYKKYKKYYSMVDENVVNANEVYDDCDEE